jgi:flavodoxin I
MKTLVIYDSLYANTKAVAQAIGNAMAGDVEVHHVSQVEAANLQGYDLLIVGAPTHGGRPAEAVQAFFDQAPPDAFAGMKAAAFDTRLTAKWVRIFGYAAPRIAGRLEQGGGTLVGPPAGFFVKGRKGPLKSGELERAAVWAQGLVG